MIVSYLTKQLKFSTHKTPIMHYAKDVVMLPQDYVKATDTPLQDLSVILAKEEPQHLHYYYAGYENYFDMIPRLVDGDEYLNKKLEAANMVLEIVRNKIVGEHFVEDYPITESQYLKFNRIILALEKPMVNSEQDIVTGGELLIGKWQKGFATPVHGHGYGFMNEQLITGKVRCTNYRMTDEKAMVCRVVKTVMMDRPSTLTSVYTKRQAGQENVSSWIHKFEIMEDTATLHFLPEAPRTGKGTTFTVERFEDYYGINENDVMPSQFYAPDHAFLNAGVGDIFIAYHEDFGLHYVIVTGKPEMKGAILVPQIERMEAPNLKGFTEFKLPAKLRDHAAKTFKLFHDIKVEGDNVIFPKL